MSANAEKFQLMFLGVKPADVPNTVNFNGVCISPKESIKLLGVVIDNRLSFKPHIEGMCKRVSQKTKAIYRIRNFLDICSAKILYNTFIVSIFNYCALIWTCCDKISDTLINKTHCRALRAVYQYRDQDFIKLLELDRSPSVHVRNLRLMLTEVYKSLHKMNPAFMWNLFQYKNGRYCLRKGRTLQLPPAKTRIYGVNGIVFRAALLWNNLPVEIKGSTSLAEFKAKLKNWSGIDCSCKLCR